MHPLVTLGVSIDRHLGRLLTEGGLALAVIGSLAVAIGAARVARAWRGRRHAGPARAMEKALSLVGFGLIAIGVLLALASSIAVHAAQ